MKTSSQLACVIPIGGTGITETVSYWRKIKIISLSLWSKYARCSRFLFCSVRAHGSRSGRFQQNRDANEQLKVGWVCPEFTCWWAQSILSPLFEPRFCRDHPTTGWWMVVMVARRNEQKVGWNSNNWDGNDIQGYKPKLWYNKNWCRHEKLGNRSQGRAKANIFDVADPRGMICSDFTRFKRTDQGLKDNALT